MLDLIIKNGQCYIDGGLKDVDVSIKDGKIRAIGKISEKTKETIEISNKAKDKVRANFLNFIN